MAAAERIACGPGECWTGAGGCASSVSGTVCVECVDSTLGYGYLNGSACVYETFVLNTPSAVVPVSDCGLRKCRQRGACVASAFGALCDECSGRGYVSASAEDLTPVCVCYDARYDPQAACRSLYDDATSVVEVVDAYESVTCAAHRDKYLGMYRDAPTGGTYGAPNPGVPSTCLDPYGPQPLADASTPYAPYVACATLGGPDPNEAWGPRRDFSFRTCSGHGPWNLSAHACGPCDAGWARVLTGAVDFFGSPVATCGTCAAGFGPMPPNLDWSATASEPPYCVAPYADDPRDGVYKECGGGGRAYDRACVCFADSTRGFFNLSEATGACTECADGYGPEADCRTRIGETTAPAPPSLAPTLQPTVPPFRTSSCVSCYERVRGEGAFEAGSFVGPVGLANASACFADCAFEVQGASVVVDGAACTNTSLALAGVGYEICDAVPGCLALDWAPVFNSSAFVFRFVNDSSYTIFPSAEGATWSLACFSTSRPSRAPTAYPTRYPSLAPTRAPSTAPTTRSPTAPTTSAPTTLAPSTLAPTANPTTLAPSTLAPS